MGHLRSAAEGERGLYALLEQRDNEAFWERVSPDFVFDFSRRLIDPVVLCGRDQVGPWAEREFDVWDEPPFWEPKELIDAGDKVLAFIRTGGRGRASGVAVEVHVWNVWTFRDGKPAEWTYFREDRAAALEAVAAVGTRRSR